MAFLSLCVSYCHAIDIDSSSGGWTKTITSANLTGSAGTNLTTTYTSDAAQTVLNITNCTGNTDNWRVDIRKLDGTWNSSLILAVRRTSSGTGGGAISSGTSYITISTIDQAFFSGRGNRSGINNQYRLSGVSLSVPPGIYTTTVMFTVVDN